MIQLASDWMYDISKKGKNVCFKSPSTINFERLHYKINSKTTPSHPIK